MADKQHILLVDDDPNISHLVRLYLEKEGFGVTECDRGDTAIDAFRSCNPALVLLDVMLPGKDGLEVLKEIRMASKVPVIMLTAKDETFDKVLGLELGADDYITKPFNILELKARIRALIRRSSMAPAAPAEPDSGKLVRGHIEIDPERRSAHRFGQNVELTLKEFDLIELLMRNPGKVYSREQLLDLVWGYDYQGDIRTVDVHIRRLREKLERNPAAPEYIITKWGVGYYFAEA